ncbi:hypothetical protein [Lewinella sp. IMCC34191]|uniref:hypothetical protein n=1 Tax=Lewinella sp. IMCC34191 TaxID=2259172 RepID=UPI000E284B21|nr:hypothetical protein [Lewinella sp. IMCC34191]
MESEFVQLGRCLLKAYAKRDYYSVSAMALVYLDLAENNRDSWNYGNAIHQANTLLGLVELQNGRIDRATDYLLSSAKTPGSPQLHTFGPNMLLADRLLALGQRRAVVNYLKQCRRLWRLSFGTLLKWRWQILRGYTPNFGANLSYLTDYKSF